MSDSRRKFLQTGLMAALFTAAPLKSVFAQSFKERDGNPGETPPPQIDPLGSYSKSAFVSYLNSIFQLHTTSGIVEVTLVKVSDMPAPKGGECFSLLFRGGSKALKQDTYVMVHPALGTFALFLVPGGSDQNGAQEFVATFNRLSLADLANTSAPARVGAARSNSSPTRSSSGNSTSTQSQTSTGSTSTQISAPSVPQTNVGPTVTTATSPSSSTTRSRKRKPATKRVDAKSPVIN